MRLGVLAIVVRKSYYDTGCEVVRVERSRVHRAPPRVQKTEPDQPEEQSCPKSTDSI